MEIKLVKIFWQETELYEVCALPHTAYFHLGVCVQWRLKRPVLVWIKKTALKLKSMRRFLVGVNLFVQLDFQKYVLLRIKG